MSENTLLPGALHAWNNFTSKQLEECWKLYIHGYGQPVGYVEDEIKEKAVWETDTGDVGIDVDNENKTITFKQVPGDECPCGDVDQNVINEGFKSFYRNNIGNKFFDKKTSDHFFHSQKPDYHPVFTKDRRDLKNLKVPSWIRGILGIVTAGIHVNVYTTDENKKVNKVWVSKRREEKRNYGGCYDQIIAGGMDPQDERDPWKTFKHEAEEESKYRVKGQEFWSQSDDKCIGEAKGPFKIYFSTKKVDAFVGDAERGHIEPGLRFCFDVEIKDGETPHHNPVDSHGFQPRTVGQIKQSLKEEQWKPNSGLVMLDFLYRHDLLDSDEESQAVKALHTPPFDEGMIPEFHEKLV